MFEDTTIVVQGLLHNDIPLKRLLENYSKVTPHILLSLYDYQEESVKPILQEFPAVRYIINNPQVFLEELSRRNIPKKTSTDELHNCYFQMRSMLSALPHVQTPYLLFCRIDHEYSNLDEFIRIGHREGKFVTSSFVARGFHIPSWRCHFSDCLFFGETEKIKQVFTAADREYQLQNLTYKPPESRIWMPYFSDILKEKGLRLDSIEINDYVSILSNYMYIVPVHTLSPFKIKAMNRILCDNDLINEKRATEHYMRNGMSF